MDETQRAFEALKAELVKAFAAPDKDYRPLTAAEVIHRNRPLTAPARK
jgi:antitoxin ParD1/3/4